MTGTPYRTGGCNDTVLARVYHTPFQQATSFRFGLDCLLCLPLAAVALQMMTIAVMMMLMNVSEQSHEIETMLLWSRVFRVRLLDGPRMAPGHEPWALP